MDPSEVWALVRNLSTKELQCVSAVQLCVVTGEFQYKRPKFKDLGDIQRGVDYALFCGDEFIFHNLIKLADKKKLILKMIADPRRYKISIPPRRSLTPVVYPASAFRLVEEKDSSNEQRADALKAAGKQKKNLEAALLAKHDKKVKASCGGNVGKDSTKNIKEVKKVQEILDSEHKDATKSQGARVICDGDINFQEGPPKKIKKVQRAPLDLDEKNSADKASNVSSSRDDKNDVSKASKKEDKVQEKQDFSSENINGAEGTTDSGGPCGKEVIYNECDGQCKVALALSSTIKERDSCILSLQSELSKCKEEMKIASDEILKLKLEKDLIQENFKKDLVDTFVSEVKNLPALTIPDNRAVSCELQTLQPNLCLHSDEEDETVTVPSGMVHIGSRQFVSKKAIAQVEKDHTKFTARLRALCKEIWGEDLQNWSLSSKSGKLITREMTRSIATILRTMDWEVQDLPKTPRKKQKGDKEPHSNNSSKVPLSNTSSKKKKDKSCITEATVRYNIRHCYHEEKKGDKYKKNRKERQAAAKEVKAKEISPKYDSPESSADEPHVKKRRVVRRIMESEDESASAPTSPIREKEITKTDCD